MDSECMRISKPKTRINKALIVLTEQIWSAPDTMSAATVSVWPIIAAQCRAVVPCCGGWIQRQRRRGTASTGASAASALSPVCELASARAWRAPCLSARRLHCCS
jgi:hypothetical protein